MANVTKPQPYINLGKFIVPDKSLGHLYDFELINPDHLQKIAALPATFNQEENKTHAWMLVYSSYRWQSYAPLLVPVRGVLDKAGNSIKSFGKGFENISTQTPDEHQLHLLSEAMFAQGREETTLKLCDLLNNENYISENYTHWKQVISLLSGQRFVYRFGLAHPRYFIKQAPQKSRLQKISISVEKPQIQFTLKDKGNYYQLSIQFLIRDIPIKSPVSEVLFFICDARCYYFFDSLRDAAVAHGMNRFNNVISVLKSGFPLFEMEILRGIEAMYPVIRR